MKRSRKEDDESRKRARQMERQRFSDDLFNNVINALMNKDPDFTPSIVEGSPQEREAAYQMMMRKAKGKGKIKKCGRGGKRISGRGKTTKPTKRLPIVYVGSSPPPSYDHEEERKKKAIMADMRKLGVAEQDLPPKSLPYKMLEILRQAQQDVVDSNKEYAKLRPLFKRPRPMPTPPSLEPSEIDLDKILADEEFSKQLFSSP